MSNEAFVITGPVRLSYPRLFESYSKNEKEQKFYSSALLIRKEDKKTIAAIETAIEAAKKSDYAKKLWGDKIPKKLKLPLRDPDTEAEEDDKERGPEYDGMLFLNAKSKRKPQILNRRKELMADDVAEEEIYPGVWCLASINFYPYSVDGSNGIGVGLNNLMKYRDDEALAGSRSAKDDFAAVEIDEDDGFLD